MKAASGRAPASESLAARVAAVPWASVAADLDSQGHSILRRLLDVEETAHLADMYRASELFRSRVVMERHGYGRGEYQYFAYPLPELVAGLRELLYARLAAIATAWSAARGRAPFPDDHRDYVARCHAAGQARPTPLLLRYGAGDYNRLHQDLYGDEVFPLQVTILLSKPEIDFTGGEFVMTEQRARMQSRPMVVPLDQGDAVVFAVRDRPVQGARGLSTAVLRHGVSVVRSGGRLTAGIIFHDAR
ncbi:MAG TPA: 2OG-Fe(II) oxygenase [Candidatus Limnocylindrales bacterium]|nr:2OG-Fe(II) oxygenase [Candidatus Limnocylindrales bacterium]